MNGIDFATAGLTELQGSEMVELEGGVIIIVVAGYSVGKALAIVGGAALVGAAAGAALAYLD